MRLGKLLDRWLNQRLRDNPENRRQSQALLVVTGAMVLGGGIVVGQQLLLGNVLVASSFGSIVMIGLLTMLALRLVPSTKLVASLVPMQVYLGVTVVNLHNDGLGYPSFFALAMAAQVAFLLSGARSGLAFALAGFAQMVFLWWVHPAATEISSRPNWPNVALSGGVVLLISLCGLAWAYESLRQASLQDVDEAREEANSANQAKSEFLANVSHEIRTPMNGVLGSLELLEARLRGDDAQLAGVARNSARSLLSLLDNVLDMSRLEAGAVQLELTPTDLPILARECLELFRSTAAAKGLAVVVPEAEAGRPWVRTDPHRLRQVLTNLLGNAIKFTAEGEVGVAVELTPEGESVAVRIQVWDTGCGIPADELGSIFERFRQADGSTTRRFGGSGLGLSISRELVERLGGALSVESAVGAGTRFTIALSLPRAEAPAAVVAPATPGALPADLRVLLVEDDATNRLVCSRLLSQLGVEPETATDGQQALDAVRASSFDVVFMDCQMPRMDGFDATRAIRALPEARGRVPIVALTAQALAGDREACLAAGMNDYLTKPITRAALHRALSTWSDRAATD